MIAPLENKKLLTEKQEKRLGNIIQGNVKKRITDKVKSLAIEKFVNHNLGLIFKIIDKYKSSFDFEELFSSGLYGLYKASRKYNPKNPKASKFSTYAYFVIKRQINRDFFYSHKINLNPEFSKDFFETNHNTNRTPLQEILDDEEKENFSLVLRVLNSIPKNERGIIEQRFLQEKTLRQIRDEQERHTGRRYTIEGIRQIQIRSLKKLKYKLKSYGYTFF